MEMRDSDVARDPVAHVSEDGRRESVATHLREVADMAGRFADETGLPGLSTYARAAGAYHDLGKYSNAFQERILRNGPRVDHSTAGAYSSSPRADGCFPTACPVITEVFRMEGSGATSKAPS